MSKESWFSRKVHSVEREMIFSGKYDLREDLRFIRDEYGIKIRLAKYWPYDDVYYIRAKSMDYFEANDRVEGLRTELEKYPPELIRNSNLGEIRCLKNFYDKKYGKICDGMTTSKGIILKGKVASQVIHHELIHWLDGFNKDLLISPVLNSNAEQWKINFTKERYLGHDCWLLEKRPKGYASRYGTFSLEEDRATVGELLMSRPNIAFEMAKYDPVLKNKINLIKNLLTDKSCGLMNKQYFNDLINGRVGKGYWQI